MGHSNDKTVFLTKPLVQGSVTGRYDTDGNSKQEIFPVLSSETPLSFWGGIDELTGVVIDTSHPLNGQCVTNTILVLPSGRGSCTASQVLLELILNDKAPKAILLRDRDGLICVGALIAQTVFQNEKLDILQVENGTDFDALIELQPTYGSIGSNGTLIIGNSMRQITEKVEEYNSNDKDLAQSLHLQDDDDLSSWSLEEQAMLANAQSDAERRAVKCIVEYARIVSPDHPTYVDVEQAHIDGCTYIGTGGLAYVEQLVQEGGKVKIPTTLNSVSTDLRFWKQLGIIPTESQQNSIKLADAYVELGCSDNSFTCAPYLLDSAPTKDQQIVWGESNAVVYANTVLGARTEKYADYLDICCAIVGKVPAVGVHLDEHRKPKILLNMQDLEISTDNKDSFQALFPVLGHLCGSLSDGEVPLLIGLEKYKNDITTDHLKAFCAAFGTTAASPLIHIAGISPEATSQANVTELKKSCCQREVTITAQDLEETYRFLDQHEEKGVLETGNDINETDHEIDWIALGNPHLSLSECDELLHLMTSTQQQSSKVHDNVTMIACISRSLYDQSSSVRQLEDLGVTFVRDTCWCMLLHPPMIPSDPTATILTNSGKYAHYGPGLTGRKFRFGTMKDCVYAAGTGMLPRWSAGGLSTTQVPWSTSTRAFSTSLNGGSLSTPASFMTGSGYTKNFLSSALCLLRTMK
jgi:predicted aconitase/predicted aconitase with swiveling domain